MLDWFTGITSSYRKTLKYILSSVKFSLLDFFIEPTDHFSVLGVDAIIFTNLNLDVQHCNDLLASSMCPLRLIGGRLKKFSLKFLLAVKRSDWVISDAVLHLTYAERFNDEPKFSQMNRAMSEQRLSFTDEVEHKSGSVNIGADDPSSFFGWLVRYLPNLTVQFHDVMFELPDHQKIFVSDAVLETIQSLDSAADTEKSINQSSDKQFEFHVKITSMEYSEIDSVTHAKLKSIRLQNLRVVFMIVHEDASGYSWNISLLSLDAPTCISVNIDTTSSHHRGNPEIKRSIKSQPRSMDNLPVMSRNGAKHNWRRIAESIMPTEHASLSQSIDDRARKTLISAHLRLWMIAAVEFWTRTIQLVKVSQEESYKVTPDSHHILNSCLYSTSKTILFIKLILTNRLTPSPDTEVSMKGSIERGNALTLILSVVSIRQISSLWLTLIIKYQVVKKEAIQEKVSIWLNDPDETAAASKIDECICSSLLLSSALFRLTFNRYTDASQPSSQVEPIFINSNIWFSKNLDGLYSEYHPAHVVQLLDILNMRSVDFCSLAYSVARETIFSIWFHTRISEEMTSCVYSHCSLSTHSIIDLNLPVVNFVPKEIAYLHHFWNCGLLNECREAGKMAKRVRNLRKSMKGVSRHDRMHYETPNLRYVPDMKVEDLIRKKLYLRCESDVIISSAQQMNAENWSSLVLPSDLLKPRDLDVAFKFLDNWHLKASPKHYVKAHVLYDCQSDGLYGYDIMLASLWRGGNGLPLCCSIKSLMDNDHSGIGNYIPIDDIIPVIPKRTAAGPSLSTVQSPHAGGVGSGILPTGTNGNCQSTFLAELKRAFGFTTELPFIDHILKVDFKHQLSILVTVDDHLPTSVVLTPPIQYIAASRQNSSHKSLIINDLLIEVKDQLIIVGEKTPFCQISHCEESIHYRIASICCSFDWDSWMRYNQLKQELKLVNSRCLSDQENTAPSDSDFYAKQYGLFILENLILSDESPSRERLVELEMSRVLLYRRMRKTMERPDVEDVTKTMEAIPSLPPFEGLSGITLDGCVGEWSVQVGGSELEVIDAPSHLLYFGEGSIAVEGYTGKIKVTSVGGSREHYRVLFDEVQAMRDQFFGLLKFLHVVSCNSPQPPPSGDFKAVVDYHSTIATSIGRTLIGHKITDRPDFISHCKAVLRNMIVQKL
eukprot:GHVH01000599.1.p1 GENE.GHVH01000599.1~~GHVH01000599.1.p1  ORF type:complete len:1168 (+),score=169.01 GHVH01000599.1:79-3582(+)